MFFFHATHVSQGYERGRGADAENREKGASGPALAALLSGGAFTNRDPLEPFLFRRAPSLNLGVIFEKIVNDASVVGIQRRGLHRTASGARDIGELFDLRSQRVVAHGTVVLNIHDYARGWGILGEEEPVHEMLEVFHHLLAAANQALGLVGEDLEDGCALVLLQLDGRHKAEIPEDGIEDFSGLRVHGEWRFLLFVFASTAARLATMLFFSRVGRGLFRVM